MYVIDGGRQPRWACRAMMGTHGRDAALRLWLHANFLLHENRWRSQTRDGFPPRRQRIAVSWNRTNDRSMAGSLISALLTVYISFPWSWRVSDFRWLANRRLLIFIRGAGMLQPPQQHVQRGRLHVAGRWCKTVMRWNSMKFPGIEINEEKYGGEGEEGVDGGGARRRRGWIMVWMRCFSSIACGIVHRGTTGRDCIRIIEGKGY